MTERYELENEQLKRALAKAEARAKRAKLVHQFDRSLFDEVEILARDLTGQRSYRLRNQHDFGSERPEHTPSLDTIPL